MTVRGFVPHRIIFHSVGYGKVKKSAGGSVCHEGLLFRTSGSRRVKISSGRGYESSDFHPSVVGLIGLVSLNAEWISQD